MRSTGVMSARLAGKLRPGCGMLWCIAAALCITAACGESSSDEDGDEATGAAETTSDSENVVVEGRASRYSDRLHGRKTASGQRYDKTKLTAAHRKLPFGTRVHVTNLNNGRSVVVRINDRGPFAKGRIIDLSRAAAEQIGMIEPGVVPVRLEILGEESEVEP